MSDFKYTSDGKKVKVIGKLNSTDTIVQEIFISDGGEIPSGEQFIVKSLHEKPVESWKERNLRETEERYDRRIKEMDNELSIRTKRHRDACNELSEKASYIFKLIKNANPEVFETLADYLTGKIEWVVVNDYKPKILPISEFHQTYEDKLRLVSLFGKDDGTLQYAMGEYYDFSGGNKKFHPFKTFEEAKDKFLELISLKGLDKEHFAMCDKYNIEIPKDLVDKYYQKMIEQTQKNIESNEISLNKAKENRKQLEKEFKSLTKILK